MAAEPQLLTASRIATAIGKPLRRVRYMLAKCPHLKPTARVGNVAVYHSRVVPEVRYQLDLIDVRRERRCRGRSPRASSTSRGAGDRDQAKHPGPFITAAESDVRFWESLASVMLRPDIRAVVTRMAPTCGPEDIGWARAVLRHVCGNCVLPELRHHGQLEAAILVLSGWVEARLSAGKSEAA